MVLLEILRDIIAPVFLLMGCGYVLDKVFNLDMHTLSKLNIYLLIPSLVFVNLSRSPLTFGHLWSIILFSLCMLFLLFLISTGLSMLRRHDRPLRAAFNLSVMFDNSGNFSIPVVDLAFPGGTAVAIQSVILAMQNIYTFTVGVFLVSRGRYSIGKAVRKAATFPPIYAALAALIVQQIGWALPELLWIPLERLSHALIPVALVTLGTQLARGIREAQWLDLSLGTIARLLLAPILALGVVKVLGITGLMSQVLVVSSAAPPAVNTVLIAIELDNRPDYAANAIFFSTLLSGVTVALVIYLMRLLA